MQSVIGSHAGKNQETIVGLRKDTLRYVFLFSSAQASSGILVFVLGIAITALGAGSGMFPFTTGYGIWTGLTVCCGGVAGVLLSRCNVDYNLPPPLRIRTLGGLYYGLCISGFSMFGIALGYSISAVVAADSKHYSSTTKTSTYLSHADQLQNIGIIIILLSVVMGVTSVYGFIFFIRKRKLFGFYSRGEQELLKRISSLENQVDDLRGQNQQGYGTAGMGNTYGEVDKTGLRQENYNQWPEKPPEYSKS